MQPQYNRGNMAGGVNVTTYMGAGATIQPSSSTVFQYAGRRQPRTTYSHNPYIVGSFSARQSTALGISLVVVGVMSITINIIELAITGVGVGLGIWCGVPIAIAGSLGIVAGSSRTRCTITAFMVMAIIGNILAGIRLVIGAIYAAAVSFVSDYCEHDDGRSTDCNNLRALAAMGMNMVTMAWLMVIMAATAFVACLWGSILGCQVSCCTIPYAPLPTCAQPISPGGITVISQQQQQQQPQQTYSFTPVYPGHV